MNPSPCSGLLLVYCSPCRDAPTILRLSLTHPYPLAVVTPARCSVNCACQNMWEFTISARFQDRWCGQRAHWHICLLTCQFRLQLLKDAPKSAQTGTQQSALGVTGHLESSNLNKEGLEGWK